MRKGTRMAFLGVLTATLMVVSALILTMPSVSATAEEYSDDTFRYVLNSDGTAVLTGYEGYDSHVDVPGTVGYDGKEYVVTSIETSAFEGCYDITSINFEGRIDRISTLAFKGCTSLETIDLTMVVEIDKNAFYGCTGLKSVLIGAETKLIHDTPFTGCTAIESFEVHPDNSGYTSVDGVLFTKDMTVLIDYPASLTGGYTVPDGVIEIGINAFTKGSIEDVVLSDSVSVISRYAFFDCADLVSVDFGDGVDVIRDGAFKNSSITGTVDLTYVGHLGSGVFDNCDNITTVIYGADTDFEYGSFIGCDSLVAYEVDPDNPAYASVDGVLFTKDQTVLLFYPAGRDGGYTVPDNVIAIETGAFRESSIESVVISDSVQYIWGYAFYKCTSLNSVDLGEGVVHIDDSAFASCSALEAIVIPDSVTFLGNEVFQKCTSLGTVDIGSGVTAIEGGTFSDTAITTFTVPATIQSIDANAFYLSKIFEAYDVDPDNPYYVDVDGVLFTKDMSTLVHFPHAADTTYHVPEGVDAIGSYAFFHSLLQDVELPSSVRSIGEFTFASSMLQNISFSEGLEVIGENAFAKCSKLESLDFPSTLKYIESGAFEGCTSVESSVVPEGVHIADYAFNGICGVVEGITPEPGTVIGHDYVDHVCTICGDVKYTYEDMLFYLGVVFVIVIVAIIAVVLLARVMNRRDR